MERLQETFQVSQRTTCRVIEQPRSTQRYVLRKRDDEEPIVHRIALNMDQVTKYSPPPNPAKITDSRAGKYIDRFGDESWELDALDPKTISGLIQATIDALRDKKPYEAQSKKTREGREILAKTANHWPSVVKYVESID